MSTAASKSDESQPFQAEVAELLNLMVHAVYSDTEIFLRELVSNASDACDKLRYEATQNPDLLNEEIPLAVEIAPDEQTKTLTISDTGIGMSREELISNLGTIARSGTKAFVEGLKASQSNTSLIGQFGVGFYSAFMVADSTEVISRRAGSDEVWIWRSDGQSGFQVDRASPEQSDAVLRGTKVTLRLKQSAYEYLQAGTIERIVKLYSNHIQFPIMVAPTGEQKRQINTASAIWQRSKSDVAETEYVDAYKSLSHGYDSPALTIHYQAEGRQAYAVLLFVPTDRPFDLFDQERKGRVKLYVRRVFIADDVDLLPPFLRFVRGVIDSEDLPLNISREMLQKNPQVEAIRSAVANRVVTELERFAKNNSEEYLKVWNSFGPVLKEGIYEDAGRREKLLSLSLFASTRGDGLRSLTDYIADMRPNQERIYYLIGDSLSQMQSNPRLEAARAHGIEVLLLMDNVDPFWTAIAPSFQDKSFQSLSQGDIEFGSIPRLEESDDEGKADTPSSTVIDEALVLASVRSALKEHVSDVRASRRLVDSPACLVAEASGPDRKLDRILSRSQTDQAVKPVLELNMKHPLVKVIADRHASHKELARDISLVLLGQAQILDGEIPDNPSEFAQTVNRLIATGLAV
ncbi:MAG: molecular chaperone HtpG [Hyphomicrobiaceae bacterium]